MARREVLQTNKSIKIWPKELQLISRQTHKQVKKLVSKYSIKTREQPHRTEPFGDISNIIGCNVLTKNHPSAVNIETKGESADELTTKKSSGRLPIAAIMSPKPTDYK